MSSLESGWVCDEEVTDVLRGLVQSHDVDSIDTDRTVLICSTRNECDDINDLCINRNECL